MTTAAPLLTKMVDDVTIVRFTEPSILDAQLIQQISNELSQLADDRNNRKLLLDFTDVDFLSSSALGVFVTLKKKTDAAKLDLIMCGMNEDLRKVFKITNLDKLFRLEDDDQSALTALGVTTADPVAQENHS